jgi:hypothetical protein
MILIFVHGWSVTDTNTYGKLPAVLEALAPEHNLDIDIQHIWLGRYISFKDEISMTDVVRAFNQALVDQIPDNADCKKHFSCITHSTGGPVIREWVDRYYGADKLDQLPLDHLVMLAPANHGSSLAKLGKARVSRIKSWFQGVEPGQKILNWLCLGSTDQYRLCKKYLNYKPSVNGFYPFVLTGQTIDKKCYDFLNTYLVEVGSDGVVRVAGANLNYSMIKLIEDKNTDLSVKHQGDPLACKSLKLDGNIRRPAEVPLGVVPGASHSGKEKGIMGSVTSRNVHNKPVVPEIFECLKVKSEKTYKDRIAGLKTLTQQTQECDRFSKKHRYSMIVFMIYDDQGDPISDYDLFILAGEEYDPDKLPKNFARDKQQNSQYPNHLIYYLDYDVLKAIKNDRIGFRIIARPAKEGNFSYYYAAEYRAEADELEKILRPNETIYLEIVLHRHVDKEVFRLDEGNIKQHPFDDIKPSNENIKY